MNMQNSLIKVSVVIPAYNCQRYICRSIDSVLNQSVPVDEIIVVDDGSVDGTAEKVRGYGDKVRYIYQNNAGVSVARNAGVMAAKSDWVAFLDADDEWVVDKNEQQLKILVRHPDLVWVSGNYVRCLCDEKRQRPHLPERVVGDILGGVDYHANFFEAFVKESYGHTDTMLIRKDALREAGLFRVGQNQMEDMDLWWKIARLYPAMGYAAKPLAIHHLGIEGSLIQSGTNFDMCRKMVCEHLDATAGTAVEADFKRCAIKVLKGWIRGMLFKRQKAEIGKMLDDFGELLGRGYVVLIRLLIVWPGLTATMLHGLSRIVRATKLRQQLTRKPVK